MQAHLALRLAAFQGAVFIAFGVLLPFWALWLDSRGLSSAEIGFVVALPVWTRVVTGPTVAWIADRSGDTRRVLCWLCVGGVLSYALFGYATAFWQFLVLAVCAGSFLTAIAPLADDLTLRAAYRHGLDYGRVRMWGTITYVSTALLGGAVVERFAKDSVVLMVVAAFALSVLASLALPNIPRGAGPISGGRIGPLLRDPAFLTFMAAGALIQASHGVLYGFATLHWEAAGHSSALIGWLWAESAMLEILLFAGAAAIVQRVGVINLLVLGAVAAIVRWLITGSTTALPALFIAQALHALSFGATHLGSMHFIARTAPPGASARAQMAYGAVALGIGNGITLMSAGLLYGALNGGAFYVMVAVAALGLVCALILRRLWQDPGAPRPA